MTESQYLLYIAVMALVTYLIRMLPITLFRRKITSRRIRSFLYYIPYSVLGAMTIPAVFYSTGSLFTACAGFAAALALSFAGQSLTVVALLASAVAFLAGLIPL